MQNPVCAWLEVVCDVLHCEVTQTDAWMPGSQMSITIMSHVTDMGRDTKLCDAIQEWHSTVYWQELSSKRKSLLLP